MTQELMMGQQMEQIQLSQATPVMDNLSGMRAFYTQCVKDFVALGGGGVMDIYVLGSSGVGKENVAGQMDKKLHRSRPMRRFAREHGPIHYGYLSTGMAYEEAIKRYGVTPDMSKFVTEPRQVELLNRTMVELLDENMRDGKFPKLRFIETIGVGYPDYPVGVAPLLEAIRNAKERENYRVKAVVLYADPDLQNDAHTFREKLVAAPTDEEAEEIVAKTGMKIIGKRLKGNRSSFTHSWGNRAAKEAVERAMDADAVSRRNTFYDELTEYTERELQQNPNLREEVQTTRFAHLLRCDFGMDPKDFLVTLNTKIPPMPNPFYRGYVARDALVK